jgi:hypothetical protein
VATNRCGNMLNRRTYSLKFDYSYSLIMSLASVKKHGFINFCHWGDKSGVTINQLQSILYKHSLSVCTKVTLIALTNGHSATDNKDITCVVRRVRLYSVPPTIDYNKTSELVSVIVTYIWRTHNLRFPYPLSQNAGFIYRCNRKASSFVFNFPRYSDS